MTRRIRSITSDLVPPEMYLLLEIMISFPGWLFPNHDQIAISEPFIWGNPTTENEPITNETKEAKKWKLKMTFGDFFFRIKDC